MSIVETVKRICMEEAIDCRFERVNGYLFLGEHDKERELDEELEAARSAGVKVVKLPQADVSGFKSGPCLRFAGQAQFHPLRYLHGVAHACARRGVQIFGRTKAVDATGGTEAVVTTEGGHRIVAHARVVENRRATRMRRVVAPETQRRTEGRMPNARARVAPCE